jgi:tetratricopeptide (TPR) repeat protein
MTRTVAILLVSSTLVGIGFAQAVTQDSLEIRLGKAKTFYYSGEYEYAIRELEDALQYLKQLKQTDQVEAYKYLAFSYVAFGDRNKAKEQFKKALFLDPDIELDPATVSPKIIKVFEEAKAEFAVSPPPEPAEPVTTEKEEISAFDATIRSCCVGGWGQMYRGESSKGKKMMIAWGVTMGTTLVSWVITGNKRDAYKGLSWDEPSSAFDDAYDKYKFWYNIAVVNTLIFLGVHTYNLYDVIFHRPRTRTSMIESDRGFVLDANTERVRLGYILHF